jgi:hypothetical protein
MKTSISTHNKPWQRTLSALSRLQTASRLGILLFLCLLANTSFAQTPSDFWNAFEKCTQTSAFQEKYPVVSYPNIHNHKVMNHGVTIPSPSGLTFSQSSFELLDKSAIMAQNATHFFLIHEVKFTENTANFEIVYYYNFDGSYNQFVAINFALNKVDGLWNVSESKIK